MDEILVAVFRDGDEVREGSRMLRDLDAAGSIDVFAMGVLAMGEGGHVAVLDAPDAGPLGSAVRPFTDRLLVALAGRPHPAMRLGVGEDLVERVTRQLRPGGAVLVAEIWEQWVQPVDAQLSIRGAVVLRRRREDVAVADIERERAALEAESADLEHRRSRVARKDQAALERKIKAVEDGIRAVRNRARATLTDVRAEHDAKMAVLLAKLVAARGSAKAKVDARISERLAQHRQRTMALMRAAI